MNLNPVDFGVSSTADLFEKVQSGESVKVDRLGVLIRPHGDYKMIEIVLSGKDGSEKLVDQVPDSEEGVRLGLLEIYEYLYETDAVEGFQVDSEAGETFEEPSFVLFGYKSILAEYDRAISHQPETNWFINALSPGDVEEPEFMD